MSKKNTNGVEYVELAKSIYEGLIHDHLGKDAAIDIYQHKNCRKMRPDQKETVLLIVIEMLKNTRRDVAINLEKPIEFFDTVADDPSTLSSSSIEHVCYNVVLLLHDKFGLDSIFPREDHAADADSGLFASAKIPVIIAWLALSHVVAKIMNANGVINAFTNMTNDMKRELKNLRQAASLMRQNAKHLQLFARLASEIDSKHQTWKGHKSRYVHRRATDFIKQNSRKNNSNPAKRHMVGSSLT